MDNLIYVLFICIVAPMTLLILALERRPRLIVLYMLIGNFVSLFASELNTVLLNAFWGDTLYVTTVITPVTEEILKAVPVLFYALLISNEREKLMNIAFAAGIGFAMFENMVILVNNIQDVTVSWAIVRGFATALMHGVCTAAVGYGISFIKKRRKLFYCGTFALLAMTGIYHGIFNMLVQSDYRYLGFVLPALTFLPPLILQIKTRIKMQEEA